MSGRHHLLGICETGERCGLHEMCGATGFLLWCSWVRQGLESSGAWSRKVLELYQSSLGEEGGPSSPTAVCTADRSVCRCALVTGVPFTPMVCLEGKIKRGPCGLPEEAC